MSLEVGTTHMARSRGSSPRPEKDAKSSKSGQIKALSVQLQNAAAESRRASVQSIHSIASSFQNVFFPGQQQQQQQHLNVGCALNEEENTNSSETPLSRSMSYEPKIKCAQTEVRSNSVVSKTLSATKISKNESLKVQKKHYRDEKKRAAEELLSTLKDPSIVILADWLKVRSSLKTWMKLWCVLKPGLIVLYKSNKSKSSHWVGTILLSACEILERPSKKDGFCFKVFHPLEQSIWATKGPKGENIGALTQPLPYSYLIFRAPSESAGKCWMDALELALRCSGLLIRTMAKDTKGESGPETTFVNGSSSETSSPLVENEVDFQTKVPLQLNDSDCERHFNGMDEDAKTDREDKDDGKSETDTEDEEEVKNRFLDSNQPPEETHYVENVGEELGLPGEMSQTEEVAEENKSLIWSLVRQVRPGMDLSKVALPTFILEPRSFLDKLSDYYYHADLLSEAVNEEDPFTRFKMVVRWYLSGFYKKPKGLKKPYNPILGEIFRCCWVHPGTNSRTFYIAEQVSHHPPVSVFYITNRQEGFVVSGNIFAKSKFYGNSLSAILDGNARLTFLKRGEEYVITMPYAHCKGILIGTLTLELGGVVSIRCEKTGYHAEIEFKLKPFLGSGEASNRVTGKIRLGEETLATLSGHWDQEIFIRDKQSEETQIFWNPTTEVKQKRLKRCTVPVDSQAEFESERLWLHTSSAIIHGNQSSATHEKWILEEEQRKGARERKAKMEEWCPRFFERNLLTGDWVYKYADLRPWDPMNDIVQYENEFVIQTKTRHQTPIVHTTSILNVDDKGSRGGRGHSRGSSLEGGRVVRLKRSSMKHLCSVSSHGSGSSSSVVLDEGRVHHDSISSISGDETTNQKSNMTITKSCSKSKRLEAVLRPVLQAQEETRQALIGLQKQLSTIHSHMLQDSSSSNLLTRNALCIIGIFFLAQIIFYLWFPR